MEFFTRNDWFYEGLTDSQFREIYQHLLLNGKFDKDKTSSSDDDFFHQTHKTLMIRTEKLDIPNQYILTMILKKINS